MRRKNPSNRSSDLSAEVSVCAYSSGDLVSHPCKCGPRPDPPTQRLARGLELRPALLLPSSRLQPLIHCRPLKRPGTEPFSHHSFTFKIKKMFFPYIFSALKEKTHARRYLREGLSAANRISGHF